MKNQIKAILIENFQSTGQLSLSSHDSYRLAEEATQSGIGKALLARYHEEALKEAEEEIRFMMLKSPPLPPESPYFDNILTMAETKEKAPEKINSSVSPSVAKSQKNNTSNKNGIKNNNYNYLKLVFSAMLLLLVALAMVLWQWKEQPRKTAEPIMLRPIETIVPENDFQGQFHGFIIINRDSFPLNVVFIDVTSKSEHKFELLYRVVYYKSKREVIEGSAFYDSRLQTIEWGNDTLGTSKIKKSVNVKFVKLSIESTRLSARRDIIFK